MGDYSRTQIQKYILSGYILVDGKPQPVSFKLHGGEQIEINIEEEIITDDKIIPQNIPLDIIYEDNEIVLVNKPAGMVVHPGSGNPDGTLANALAYHFSELSDVNSPLRPGIVHRLDMDTSGIIVVAKTNFAHIKIAEQFEKRLVKKMYYGITWGNWKKPDGMINQPVARKRTDPTTYVVNVSGRVALTEYKVVKETQYFSIVNFSPKTGRTHQIRVHASFAGHSIFSDEKYGGGSAKIKGYIPEISKKMKILLKTISRHALHAKSLTITHPKTGEAMTFEAPLAADIVETVEKIEQLNV